MVVVDAVLVVIVILSAIVITTRYNSYCNDNSSLHNK